MPDTQERNLSVSLRPRRFSEVIGYTDTIEGVLRRCAEVDRFAVAPRSA